MHILIVNDDGIDAAGIKALEQAAYSIADKVSVVAPMHEHSAQSHAITVREPIIVEKRLSDINLVRYAVKGTPTDCARLAILELCPEKPDLVLSGINHGANMGWEIFFSGTVSAAAEAHSFGIPALAFSLASWVKTEFQSATRVVSEMLGVFKDFDRSQPYLYNINVPPIPYAEIKGVRMTRTEPNVKGDGYVSREAPDGRRYFWATWGDRHERSLELTDPSYDVVAVREKYVSVTKLHYEVAAEMTEGAEAEQLSDLRFH